MDDDHSENGTADLENQYFMAKSIKEDDPRDAMQAFQAVVDAQPEPGEWGFKALKQMTKTLYLVLKRPEDALVKYRELLGYTKVSFRSIFCCQVDFEG